MKKIKFILPVVAVLFAIVGVFAMPKVGDVVDIDVSAGAACPLDGKCDQSSASICEIVSTSLVFKTLADDCQTSATGKFHE